MPIYILYGIKYEWNGNISEKISFQGFGTNHPILHHNFHHKKAPGAMVLSLKSKIHTELY